MSTTQCAGPSEAAVSFEIAATQMRMAAIEYGIASLAGPRSTPEGQARTEPCYRGLIAKQDRLRRYIRRLEKDAARNPLGTGA